MHSVAAKLQFGNVDFDAMRVGMRMPCVALARLEDGCPSIRHAHELIGNDRCVVLGVPGAFTPVCTQQHIPEFIQNAPAMRKAGYARLICLAPNSPWAVARWSRDLDPDGVIEFWSDGNLDFARAFGLATRADQLFLGDCSKRFLMTIVGGAVERLKVENAVNDLTCTSTTQLLGG